MTSTEHASHPRVATRDGWVEGRTETAVEGHDGVVIRRRRVDVYRGIPYAAPPVGPLRWARPEPVDPWDGVRVCTGHPAAMQTDFYGTPDFDCSHDVSEDCLVVNIHTPSGARQGTLPVLAWIHGGAYQAGSASLPKYDPIGLASQGVVVVSIEYRVGVFGFLAHPDIAATSATGTAGNYGIDDVFAALKWVRENIAVFGGDANNVTSFGQSAGGNLSSYLLVSPEAENLIDKVIVQSGTGDPELPRTMVDAYTWGERLAQRLGCHSAAELRAVPAPQVLDAATALHQETGIMWAPVIDGRVLPDQVHTLFVDGRFRALPTLMSTTTNDTPLAVGAPMNETELVASATERWGADGATIVAALRQRVGTDDIDGLAAAVETFVQTDSRARTYLNAINGAAQIPGAYACQWERVPPGWRSLGWGAFHEIELAYLFDRYWPGYPEPEWDAWDAELAALVQRSWIAFARTGNPRVDGMPEWHPYTASRPEIMTFGNDACEIRLGDLTAQSAAENYWRRAYAQLSETET